MFLDRQTLDRAEQLAQPGAPPPVAPVPTAMVLARRSKFLSADGQTPTALELEALLETNDLVEASFLERCRLVQQCICRIRVRSDGRSGWATGFLIAPGIIITNHHVFPSQARVGTSRIEFGHWVNVAGEVPRLADEFELDPAGFYVADEKLDLAAVAVAAKGALGGLVADKGFLRLIPETGKVKTDDFVTILQHPDGDPLQIALRENKVTRAEDGESFIWYAADTAHGSSGAPVFNDSLQVVALHSSGRIKRDAQGRYARMDGTWVSSIEGLRDKDMVWEANVGFRASRISSVLLELAKAQFPLRAPVIEAAMQGGDVLASAVEQAKGAGLRVAPRSREIEKEQSSMPEEMSTKPAEGVSVQHGGIVVPLQLRITLETGGAMPAIVTSPPKPTPQAERSIAEEAMKMQVPIIYDGLEERGGFDRRFLGLAGNKEVPMPEITAAGKKVLAPLLDGSDAELKYHRFSIWMHKRRRLALFTASNVDWRNRKRIVEGKSTKREALAGFPENSKWLAEQWVEDPRVALEHQLPDIFYTDDRGAFDKGHLVRRDDMCWGTTYQDIQMSNGDTFHVTNCSPQTKPFNQGTQGDENWGDLETHIERATKADAEKACIFAGPIFAPDDRWFHGKDDQGPARIQIPSRYWKIVVVKGTSGLKAYGFILEQDVTEVTEKEFYVDENWKGIFKPIKDIAAELRGWLKLTALTACDAYDTIDWT